jgi:DNA-binding response OmpR family regulator
MKKILVVDDERPLARALELKLTHSGFEVTVAYNGNEALELIDKNNFDLAILDLVMPEVDGFTVLEKLKNKKSKLKVIVCSNLSQDEDVAKATELGAVGFFIKSDTPLAEVVESVNKFI